MSYILEAIKRSEQQRRRGKVPSVSTLQTNDLKPKRRPLRWPLVAAVTLLVGGAALVLWLQPWQPETAPDVAQVEPVNTADGAERDPGADAERESPADLERETVEETEPESDRVARSAPGGSSQRTAPVDPSTAPPATGSRSGMSEEELSDLADEAEMPVAEIDAGKIRSSATGRRAGPQGASRMAGESVRDPDPSRQTAAPMPEGVRAERLKPIPVRPSPESTVADRPGQDIAAGGLAADAGNEKDANSIETASAPRVGIYDLPPDVRSSLPNLSFSFHSYSSNPATRMIRVNDEMTREGQPVEGGLTVAEITRDGVMLEFKGHQFHMGVMEEWRAINTENQSNNARNRRRAR